MKKVFFILSAMILSGCGKHGSDNPNPGGKNNPPSVPTQATLSLPAQNAACTTGTVTSNTESSITFSWNASENTDNYELDVKNLLNNNVIKQATAKTEATVELLRGTPYSWYVISTSNKTTTTAQSDTWKFYNAGPGLTTYVPFPAELTAPTFGQQIPSSTTTMNLTWQGSSVDNAAILTYDVYFDTNSSPALSKSGVTDMFINNVKVQSGNTYYWKVITKDGNGNSSDSGVSQFSVQ